MRKPINLAGKWDNPVDFIRNPVTEMVSAFVIDMSKNFIFAYYVSIYRKQFSLLNLQYSLLILPWIMLGHGAFRYINYQNKRNTYSDLENFNSPQMSKKSLNIVSLVFGMFIIIQFLPL